MFYGKIFFSNRIRETLKSWHTAIVMMQGNSKRPKAIILS
jgi:hypothetical protein